MSVTSIHPTRISLQFQSRNLLEAIRRNQAQSFTAQTQLASGRSFVVPSDDPVAANRVLQLNDLLDQHNQFLNNATHATDVLDATDDAMTDLNALLSEAHTIASQSVSSPTSAEERVAAAQIIVSIRDQLLQIGNRQFSGLHIFGGRQTTVPPFQSALGGVAYFGDTGDLMARVSEDEFAPINLSGDALFGALSSRVSGSVDLDPALSENTRLDDLTGAQGLGVRKGVLVFNEVNGAGVVQVDLGSADTMGDVVDLINNAAAEAGAGFSAELTTTGLNITPAGDLSITDTGTGKTTADLGILTDPATAGQITGADLDVRLTPTTPLIDLAGGSGVDLTAPLRITNGTESRLIDLSEAVTVQDVLNKINNAGLYVHADINAAGTGLDVTNLVSGTNLVIADEGGSTAAALGLRSFTEDTPLSAMNRGRSIATAPGENDVRIVTRDGTRLDLNLDGVTTLGDLLALINQQATDAGVALQASLTEGGDGWKLVDGTVGDGTLSVYPLNDTVPAAALGLSHLADPGAAELVINDLSTADGDDVIAALYDLEEALRNDNTAGITTAATRVNDVMTELTRQHGVVGARAEGMLTRLTQLENVQASSQVFLSEIQDVDYAEAVTRFQEAQTTLQASLLTGSQAMDLSLMDFLR